MLVLSRKTYEQILIGDNVTITLISISRSSVRLGIEAPVDVPIVRNDAKRKTHRRRSRLLDLRGLEELPADRYEMAAEGGAHVSIL